MGSLLASHGGLFFCLTPGTIAISRYGTGSSYVDDDAANAYGYPSTDLQKLESNGVALSPGKFGTLKCDLAQFVHQHVGHRGEPQPELISSHGGRTGPVGKEI